jgi:hypothetical protein
MRSILACGAAALVSLGLTGLIPNRAEADPVMTSFNPGRVVLTRSVPTAAWTLPPRFPTYYPVYTNFYYPPAYTSYYSPAYTGYYYPPAPTINFYAPVYQNVYPNYSAYSGTSGTTYYYNP